MAIIIDTRGNEDKTCTNLLFYTDNAMQSSVLSCHISCVIVL